MDKIKIVILDHANAKLMLAKLIKETFGKTVNEAKQIVDNIEREPQTFTFDATEPANKFFNHLNGLGVKATMSIGNNAGETNNSPMIIKQIEELRKTIEALEKRIAKLESNKGASSAAASDREVIVAHKRVSDNDYFKTSKGRTLLDCSPRSSKGQENYLSMLKNALISIGDNMEPKSDESIDTFVARIRAKYNPDPTLPTLLGGIVLMQNGVLWTVTPINRAIKF